MQFVNDTPFSPYYFEAFGPQDEALHVLLCRATFEIQNHGTLTVASEQQPVVLTDEYRAGPLTSSVQVDTDLVPKKYAADITVNAVAQTPGNQPLTSWRVRIQVGRIDHSLHVTGPRRWMYSRLSGWQLTPPEPTRVVPLHFEYAFGGTQMQGDKEVVDEHNPVGCGFGEPRSANRKHSLPAPQIEFPDNPIVQFGKNYRPAGWGPIAKHWLPRRLLCGTADATWVKERWPLRPRDFDFRYYNSAPEGLVYPGYLRGDESVVISGASPLGPVAFQLPRISITMFALDRCNSIILESMTLDTLHIDLTKMRVFLTWRLAAATTKGLKSIQIVPETLSDDHPRRQREFIDG